MCELIECTISRRSSSKKIDSYYPPPPPTISVKAGHSTNDVLDSTTINITCGAHNKIFRRYNGIKKRFACVLSQKKKYLRWVLCINFTLVVYVYMRNERKFSINNTHNNKKVRLWYIGVPQETALGPLLFTVLRLLYYHFHLLYLHGN